MTDQHIKQAEQSLQEAMIDLAGAPYHPGAVYCIGPTPDGPIKIGVSNWIPDRIAALQTSHYAPLFVTAIVFPNLNGDNQNVFRIEKRVHKRLASCRLMGEWFDITAEGAEDEIRAACKSFKMPAIDDLMRVSLAASENRYGGYVANMHYLKAQVEAINGRALENLKRISA